MNVVSASQWTQAERGSSRVEVAGVGDKRQITVTVARILDDHMFFPFRCCMKARQRGTTLAILEGFDIWHTLNHWANAQTSVRFVENVIVPYTCTSTTRKNPGLGDKHMVLVIFDTFRGHKGDEMESTLLKNIIVPSNCTDLFQL